MSFADFLRAGLQRMADAIPTTPSNAGADAAERRLGLDKRPRFIKPLEWADIVQAQIAHEYEAAGRPSDNLCRRTFEGHQDGGIIPAHLVNAPTDTYGDAIARGVYEGYAQQQSQEPAPPAGPQEA